MRDSISKSVQSTVGAAAASPNRVSLGSRVLSDPSRWPDYLQDDTMDYEQVRAPNNNQ